LSDAISKAETYEKQAKETAANKKEELKARDQLQAVVATASLIKGEADPEKRMELLEGIQKLATGEVSIKPLSETNTHLKVLLMDDSRIVRETGEKVFMKLGHSCTSVNSGDGALKLYEQAMDAGEPFDVVILDLLVENGMNGDEAARQLKERHPEAKLVVVSGDVNNQVIEKFGEFGFDAAMTKPYTPDSVSEVLGRINGLQQEKSTSDS
jgi:CheY-like chemotaxis protein